MTDFNESQLLIDFLTQPETRPLGQDDSPKQAALAELRSALYSLIRRKLGNERFYEIKHYPVKLAEALREAMSDVADLSLKTSVKSVASAKVRFKSSTRLPLGRTETAAVALFRPKTAALIFDRIWCPWAPDEIRFFTGTDAEAELLGFISSFPEISGSDEELPMMRLCEAMGISPLTFLLPLTMPSLAQELPFGPGSTSEDLLARAIGKSLERSVPVVLSSEIARSLEYSTGNQEVIFAILSGLQIVDETAAEWGQVLEFRKDAEARKKYHSFVHWMDKEMVGKSRTYIQQDIIERLSKYQWALEKHGLKTVQGALSTMLDQHTLIPTAIATASANVVAGELLAVLTAIGMLVGNVSLSVAKEMVDLKDRKLTTHPEIAYVHEATSELGSKAK